MLAKTIAETNKRIFTGKGMVTHLYDYWGPPTGSKAGPQALLVDHPEPDSTISAHFHIVQQFQIFTSGTGLVGRHTVKPGTVQYTDEYTTYGPISGEVRYMVVRAVTDPGAKNMPESRALLIKPRGRTKYYQVDMTPLETGTAVRDLSDESDGMKVSEVKMAPSQALPDVEGGTGGQGAYYAVLDGEIDFGGQQYFKEACIYVAPGEALSASAGKEGAIVAFVRFPKSP